jgi:hypothetical protein
MLKNHGYIPTGEVHIPFSERGKASAFYPTDALLQRIEDMEAETKRKINIHKFGISLSYSPK